MNSPYDNYKQQSVMTMTQGEMLVKLYDEVIKQMSGACRSIGEKDYPQTNEALKKVQLILGYLDSTLDRRYGVSAGLSSLYDFFIRQTVTANVKKDAALLEEIIPLITELRDTFVQAEKLARMSQTTSRATYNLGGAVMSAVG
ncbi:MAG: flagellar export chaperone FliS [Angelakisella sp.]